MECGSKNSSRASSKVSSKTNAETNTENIAIRANNLTFKYPENAHYSVKSLSVNIKKGQCTGIIGPNGAGKSTLISLLCGLIKSKQGSISYFPYKQVNEQSNERSLQANIEKLVALVPQEYAFYGELTVKQNIEYFIALNGKQALSAQALLLRSLQQCQLEKVANQKATSLSGGYKRRLNIAIALSKSPEIIFLDEPTVGIDPISRQEIIKLLENLKNQGKTLVYTSHMLNEVEQLCDDVILLDRGQTIAIANNHCDNQILNIELVPELDHSELLVQLGIKSTVDTDVNVDLSFTIKIDGLAHLQYIFTTLATNIAQVSSIHFAKNSIDQLYFDSYKASAC